MNIYKKFILLLPLLLLMIFSNHPVNAQIPSTFFCVGTNLNPPCVTRAPTTKVTPIPSISITTAPSSILSPVAPSTPPSISPIPLPSSTISPCQNIQQPIPASAVKTRAPLPPGLLQQLIALLLQLIQLLLQLLGIQLPPLPPTIPGGPCPTISPTLSTIPTEPSITQAPSISPSPTIFAISPTATPLTCKKAVGPFTQKGTKILQKNKSAYIPYGITVSGLQYPDYNARLAGDLDQISAAANYWCSNTVRLQVGQDSLVGANGKTVSVAFMNALKKEVSRAESLGMVVVINAQTESVGFERNPTSATRSFWANVTKMYGKDPQVVFDLFNEPRVYANNDAQAWKLWQKGGTFNKITYIGMQALVNAVRNDGSKNLLWIEGPKFATTFAKLPSYPITGGKPLVYAIHHPAGAHTTQSWDNDFGFLVNQNIAPVVVGEWSNWAAARSECWPDAPTAVPQFLSYLKGKSIGLTVWMLRKGVMLNSDDYNDPSQFRSDWSCTDNLNEGAGTLVNNWYKQLNQ